MPTSSIFPILLATTLFTQGLPRDPTDKKNLAPTDQSQPQPARPIHPAWTEPLEALPAETPDYATQLSELVQAREASPEGQHADHPNKWGEMAAVVAEVRGAWAVFRLVTPSLAPAQPSPEADGGPDPLALARDGGPPARDLRTFFKALDEAGITARLNLLTDDARFVAPRSTDLLIETGTPELVAARLAVRLLMTRLRLAVTDGDAFRARTALAQALAVRRGAAGHGLFIDLHAAMGVQGVIDDTLRQAARDGLFKGSLAADLLGMAQVPLPDPALAVAGEEQLALQTTDFHWADELAAARKRRDAGDPPEPGWRPLAPRVEQLAAVGTFYDAARRFVTAPPAERAQAERDMEAVLARARLPEGPRLMPLGCSIQAVRAVADRAAQVRRGHDLAMATLALEAHRARTGRYPRALADLAEDKLSPVPDLTYTPRGDTYELKE